MNLTPGTPITNSKGWCGRIVQRPRNWPKWEALKTGQKTGDVTESKLQRVVYVRWEERKGHPGGDVLPHRPDELIRALSDVQEAL